ncbi:DUF397 domain-containing protein [Streptomyces virginiae]|uniref:DUF397 domain-containing protein n=1 Tax=Streptomyces virginiae TaxID=1961 RepID=UPI00224D79DE|nr:DUF397 domain-containing protein [Streptomyces virginiae]MCX5271133.1 DUF397 domain-containing protein [Streptomyces virginiae]
MTATCRPTRLSSARHTSPKPPRPSNSASAYRSSITSRTCQAPVTTRSVRQSIIPASECGDGRLLPTPTSCSGGTGGNCVEIAAQPCRVAVRDSKEPEGPVFTVRTAAFEVFVRSVSV